VSSPKPVHTPVPVEDEIIERIRQALGGGLNGLGLRDDAAVLPTLPGSEALVVSVDSVVEGIHFDLAFSSVQDVGWKALMSALSDLAAMGASPMGALVALCVPGLDQGDHTAVGVMEGVGEASAASGCAVVGGDVSGAAELAVVVTVLGIAPGGGAVARSGAGAGDRLYVTGPCGASAAGLRLLRAGDSAGPAVARHRRPWARLEEGLLARSAGVHAMIDVSDGLALDLHRMADASHVGFALETVPVAPGATRDEALGGGEDYELLMAVAPSDAADLLARFEAAGLAPPLLMGEVAGTTSHRVLEGRPLGRLGWQHGGAPPEG
jgi:thiamine-monophosphate kinase